MTIYLPDDCLFCIDGNQPAGLHDILGPVMRPCPVCLIVCPVCDGEGLFPADFTCIGCFQLRLADIGLVPTLCGCCFGVVDLIPTDTFPEVSHGHH
jgi:hypothetical protein